MTDKFEYKSFDGYEVCPMGDSIDLDVEYYSDYFGISEVTLDAVEVYKNLKEYFKGTEYE